MTEHRAIDGLDVPQSDGTQDPNYVQRSLELDMERVLRALVEQEMRVRRCGRRQAFVNVIETLKTLVT